jgi:prepilin-type processing-associated H-X9-DG protein
MRFRNTTRSRRQAFSLVELLVVVGILVLVGTLLVPSIARMAEMSRQAICSANLRHLGSLLQVLGREQSEQAMSGAARLPAPYGWDFSVHDKGASSYLYCESTVVRQPSWGASLRNVYVHQYGHSDSVTPGHVDSNLFDMFIEGYVNDPQITYEYQGNTNSNGMQWVYNLNGGNPPADNQGIVAIATCAAFLITITPEYVEFEPLGHHPAWMSGSDHWICEGDPEDENGWQADKLVRLTGRGYDQVNAPVRTRVVEDTDYGMNSLLRAKSFGPEQIVLVEYNKGTVWLNGVTIDEPFDGDSSNGEVQDRHLGFSNVLLADGSVSPMRKDELEAEYAKVGTGEASRWEAR